ncbi:MAG: hypothetical protein IPO38_08580 [Rhodocyclaceae bacterium]|nr:hypothetical protein [Rhodocyclaceae bacterium]
MLASPDKAEGVGFAGLVSAGNATEAGLTGGSILNGVSPAPTDGFCALLFGTATAIGKGLLAGFVGAAVAPPAGAIGCTGTTMAAPKALSTASGLAASSEANARAVSASMLTK